MHRDSYNGPGHDRQRVRKIRQYSFTYTQCLAAIKTLTPAHRVEFVGVKPNEKKYQRLLLSFAPPRNTESDMFSVARDNSPLLAALAHSCQALRIVVAEDIRDVAGAKLVAKGQVFDPELQQRLASRHLHKPLETSLSATDGVTGTEFEQTALKLCRDSAFLVTIVGRDYSQLRSLLHSLSLNPFTRLMLSVQQVALPWQFAHSVLCSVMAGVLAMKAGGPPANAQLALIAGLIHDMGEMYRSAQSPTRIGGIDRALWSVIVEHPCTAKRLIEQFTDYPDSVSQAVYEHHERLDGSGYPRGITGKEISSLGRILCLADTVCGVASAPDNQGARAKLAVSFVPGEFDPGLVSTLTSAINGTFAAEIVLPTPYDRGAALNRAKTISQRLQVACREVERLAHSSLEDGQLAEVVTLAQRRIARLNTSWEATGIGEYFTDNIALDASPRMEVEAYFDLDIVARELIWRMHSLSRMLVLLLQQRRLSDYGALEPVIEALEIAA